MNYNVIQIPHHISEQTLVKENWLLKNQIPGCFIEQNLRFTDNTNINNDLDIIKQQSALINNTQIRISTW